MATHNDTLIDMVKVILANLGAITFGFVQLEKMAEGFEWGLKIVSLIVAIAYTVWKWRKDIKRES